MIREAQTPSQLKTRRLTIVATVSFAVFVFSVFLGIGFWGRSTLARFGDDVGMIEPQPIPTATNLATPSISAVWIAATDPALESKESLQNMMNEAHNLGINTVFLQASWRYATNYPSPTLFQAKYKGRDVLQEAVEMGKVLNIKVHAWYTVLLGGSPDSPNKLWQEHGLSAPNDADKWVVQSFDGKWSDHLDPSIPEVRTLAISTAVELATHGEKDKQPAGVHLDFLRFPEDTTPVPGSEWGFSERMIKAYQTQTGGDFPQTNDQDFLAWKCDLTSSLAHEIYQAVKSAKPDSIVSAATVTWGDGPRTFTGFKGASATTDVSQCWDTWAANGYVDMIVPMAYFDEAQHSLYHQNWINYLARVRGTYPKVQVVAGQGTWLNDADETILQLRRGFQTLDGYSLYSWKDIAANPELQMQLKHAPWRR